MDDQQSLVPNNASFHAEKSEHLTARNKAFLELLSQGKSTLEAYKLAGYQGEDHAAYELKSKLSKDFEAYLSNKGMSRGDLMLAVKRLIDSPIDDYESKSVKDQIKLLALWLKMLPSESVNKPAITAFVINNHNAATATSPAPQADNIIDTTVEEVNNP